MQGLMAKKYKVRTMAQVNDPKEAGLSVMVRGTGPHDFAKALRKFKRKVAESGIIQDYRDKQYYEKPSDKRRKAKKQAVRRQQRAMQEEKNNY
jgi:small subunit ribosomal protein S21